MFYDTKFDQIFSRVSYETKTINMYIDKTKAIQKEIKNKLNKGVFVHQSVDLTFGEDPFSAGVSRNIINKSNLDVALPLNQTINDIRIPTQLISPDPGGSFDTVSIREDFLKPPKSVMGKLSKLSEKLSGKLSTR
jgi:hypothetical protein